jgi:hypothetical protein
MTGLPGFPLREAIMKLEKDHPTVHPGVIQSKEYKNILHYLPQNVDLYSFPYFKDDTINWRYQPVINNPELDSRNDGIPFDHTFFPKWRRLFHRHHRSDLAKVFVPIDDIDHFSCVKFLCHLIGMKIYCGNEPTLLVVPPDTCALFPYRDHAEKVFYLRESILDPPLVFADHFPKWKELFRPDPNDNSIYIAKEYNGEISCHEFLIHAFSISLFL